MARSGRAVPLNGGRARGRQLRLRAGRRGLRSPDRFRVRAGRPHLRRRTARSRAHREGRRAAADTVHHAAGQPTLPSCEDQPPGSDCLPVDTLSHAGGGLRFAPDGKLFVSTGDGVITNVDPFLALRAQNLDSLAGKVLRINPQDGSAPADNPFFTGVATENRSKVYALRLPPSVPLRRASGDRGAARRRRRIPRPTRNSTWCSRA